MVLLPEDLQELVRNAPRGTVCGRFARHTHPHHPLGEPPAVVRYGDRWQSPGDAGCLFTCDGARTAAAEWQRKLLTDEPVVSTRNFGWLEVSSAVVLDLTDVAVCCALGIDPADLVADDPKVCRAVLAAARVIEIEVVLAPSAARVGGVTAIVLPHALERITVLIEVESSPPFDDVVVPD